MKASLKGHALMMYDVIVFEDHRSSNDQPGFSKISFRGPFSETPFTCVDET